MLKIRRLIFCLCLLHGPILAQSKPKRCKWIANLTDMARVEDIGRHKYMIVEECLYYKLSQQSDAKTKKHNSLSLLPPTAESQSKINVNVEQIVLNDVYMGQASPTMKLAGFFQLSWSDYRLRWDPDTYKIQNLTIKRAADIWVPELAPYSDSTSVRLPLSTVEFQKIKVASNGVVNSVVDFYVDSECTSNHRDFPLEVVKCCVNTDSIFDASGIEYTLSNKFKPQIDQHQYRSKWKVAKFTVVRNDILNDWEDSGWLQDHKSGSLKICIEASRYSITMKMQLSVPMAISGILVIVAPLFGPMHTQLWVKLFALLMQIICFQFLVQLTPSAGLGSDVPKIYQFYEFTFAMTLLSLMVTLIFNALSRINKTLPPSHNVLLMAQTFNRFVCCDNQRLEALQHRDGLNDTCVDNPPTEQQTKAGQWKELFVALNNAFSLLHVVLYVLIGLFFV